jgi:hypothetical protein
MKRTLLLLALGAFIAVPAMAQQPPTNSTNAPSHVHSPGGGHMGGPMAGLTPEERQEVMAARQAAFQADPSLQAEQEALQQKIDAAMVAADPKVAPILAKMEANRKMQGQGGGPGGPPPGNKPPPSH